MKYEVTLHYGGLLLTVLTEHDSFEGAEFAWTHGAYSCDQDRSRHLKLIGVLPDCLPCSCNMKNQVQLLAIRAYRVH